MSSQYVLNIEYRKVNTLKYEACVRVVDWPRDSPRKIIPSWSAAARERVYIEGPTLELCKDKVRVVIEKCRQFIIDKELEVVFKEVVAL
jgi:hypothetical protein